MSTDEGRRPPLSPPAPADDDVFSCLDSTPNRKVSFSTLSEFSSPDEEQLSLRGQLSPSPHQFFPRQFMQQVYAPNINGNGNGTGTGQGLSLQGYGQGLSSRENTLSWGDESGGSSPRRVYPLTGSFSDMDLGFIERHRTTSYNPYPTPHANSPEESPSKEKKEGGGGSATMMAPSTSASTSPGGGTIRPLSTTRRASEPEFKRVMGMEGAPMNRFLRQKSLTDSDKRHPRHQQFLSIPRPASPEVKETFVIDKSMDESGHKKINKYVVIKEIGRGVHGKVKLCVDSETNVPYVS